MKSILAVLTAGFLISACVSTTESPTVDARPAASVILLEKTVYFTAPDGTAVPVNPGGYVVEAGDKSLRLTVPDGETPLVVAASPGTHDEAVMSPTPLSFAEDGEQADLHHLVLLFPDGKSLDAVGTYSGINTRDLLKLNQPILSPIVTVPRLPGGNILPGIPRLKSVAVASFANQGVLVPFANANVTIVLHNLLGSAGTRIPYRLVSPGSITGQSACTLTRNPRIVVPDFFELNQNGEGRISLPGWFTSAGTCAIGLELSLPGQSDPARLVAGPIQVQTPVRYTVTGTSRLKNILGVRASSSLGICEGTSIGPTNYPVGVIENGSDLAYRIRSGPIGTDCQYISKAWVLPDGARLVSTKWESVREIPSGQQQGKCCVVSAFGNNCITITRPPVESFNFSRGTAPIVTGDRAESPPYYSVTSADAQILEDGVILLENTPPRVVTVVKPMWGKLQCTNTLVNDHGVKLILRELVLEGPPGLSF